MEALVFFLEQIAVGLYILCGAGFVLAMRAYILGKAALAESQFELERELARFRTANALTVMAILVEIGLGVFAVAQVVAPTLREQPPQRVAIALSAAQETPFATAGPGDIAGTPQPDFSQGVEIQGLEEQLNLQPMATPTLTPTPVGTIIPNVSAPLGCDTPNAFLRVPVNGMVVFEATKILGGANTTNFAFYRFELNGPSTNNTWSRLADYTIPVVDGELGQILPAQLIPGEYRFALKVFDITSTQQASCTITIIISEPIPTATPIREA